MTMKTMEELRQDVAKAKAKLEEAEAKLGEAEAKLKKAVEREENLRELLKSKKELNIHSKHGFYLREDSCGMGYGAEVSVRLSKCGNAFKMRISVNNGWTDYEYYQEAPEYKSSDNPLTLDQVIRVLFNNALECLNYPDLGCSDEDWSREELRGQYKELFGNLVEKLEREKP